MADKLIWAHEVLEITGKWPNELGLERVMKGEIVRYRLSDALAHKKGSYPVGAEYDPNITPHEVEQ